MSASLFVLFPVSLHLLGALGVVSLILFLWLRSTRNALLPPGPPPLPVIGNVLDMPKTDTAQVFKEWSKLYGDVIYLRLPGQNILVLNSAQSAMDLLDRRSRIYSSRPISVMNDLMSWSFSLGFMEYGPGWRARRKYFHEYFHQGAVHRYVPIQAQEMRSFLRRVLLSGQSEETDKQVRLAFVAMIVSIVYGIKVKDLDADYVVIAREAMEGVGVAGTPGKFWVEFFPFLRFIPSWFPGAGFKRFAEYYSPFVQEMVRRPFQIVKSSLSQEDPPLCATRDLIQHIQKKYGESAGYPEQEEFVMDAMGAAYAAAADTTHSVAMCFLLAMTKYPEVQKKAQVELDRHVGQHRLPNLEDRASLTYIQAIALECMRWQPTVPLSLPHMTTTDDEYNGYRIPKGTAILSNVWAMLTDPEAYPHPEVFNPDRFIKNGALDPEVQDPLSIAFGFGRRVCPGRHLSNNALFLFVASVLHVFNIEPSTDGSGNPVPIEVKMTTGLISRPESVPCVLKPRSAAAEALILEPHEKT